MILEATWIGLAFSLGLIMRSIGLPTLVGYLIAGFALNILSTTLSLPSSNQAILDHVAHLGVLLLLFTVGLKLSVRSLIQAPILGAGLLHCLITTSLWSTGLVLIMGLAWPEAILLAIALSFSSTVLSARTLESMSELKAFHGRMAIGILILQDLIALVTITIASGKSPSLWAFSVFLLPFLRPLFFKLFDLSGSEELFILFGLLLALVVGGYGFEQLGLSSELGALSLGVLLSSHKKSKQLSMTLWSIKEIFLVGFFLQIGLSGLPTMQDWTIALGLLVILPLKGVLFFFLLLAFKLRARSAFLAGLSLTAYSEFGLILASSVLPEWLTPLALTVSLSFALSAPFARRSHWIYQKICFRLIPLELKTLHPDEQPIRLDQAQVMVMGLGRVGTAAYSLLEESKRVVGMDSDPERVSLHQYKGRNVFYADAEDHNFWGKLDLGCLEAVVLAMSDHNAKLLATEKLRERGFKGKIVANSLDEVHLQQLKDAGVDNVHLSFTEAGVSLAREIYS